MIFLNLSDSCNSALSFPFRKNLQIIFAGGTPGSTGGSKYASHAFSSWSLYPFQVNSENTVTRFSRNYPL